MRNWRDLYLAHRAMHAKVGSEFAPEVRRRLLRLAELGHCDTSIRGRFTNRMLGNSREWYIRPAGNTLDESLPLLALPDFERASLSIFALCHSRTHHLRRFAAMIAGRTAEARPWLAAIHLEDDQDDRRGKGACTHAAFHCHVGPDFAARPEVRVPFPDVGPLAALDWLISMVLPEWEPVPWSDVPVPA